MPSEVEQFAERLTNELSKYESHGYVSVPQLRRAVQEALHPRDMSTKYPMSLYRGRQECVVTNEDEEAAAKQEGFGHVPPPQYEDGCPKVFREKTMHEGGSRGWDIRKVMLRNADEERLFHAVVDEEDWTVDEGDMGGRGIGLAELVQERRELLMGLVGAVDFTAAKKAVELPHEVRLEPTTVTGADPDAAPQE